MRSMKMSMVLFGAMTLAACGNAGVGETNGEAGAEPMVINTDAPVVTFTPESDMLVDGKPTGPISVTYRIIGKPVVGQPVAIDVQITSALGPQPINVAYRINDASAMRLADSQPSFKTVSPSDSAPTSAEQVTVIPMREGRLYLNISASIDTSGGSVSTVTAIPIQVGDSPRDIQENGTQSTDENGEVIRSLPAENN